MKLFKKTNLSLALTTALAAGAMLGAQQASANLDVNQGGATVAPYVSNNSLGQMMIYPYYTVRGGKDTIFNVFNTSNKTIAAKVRFHESHNSRDVLDFVVILSPYDKWSGTISGSTGAPLFKSRDNSCTVPKIPATGVALSKIAYTGEYEDADADKTDDRMNEGYVEVIAMGQADAGLTGHWYTTTTPTLATGNVAYLGTHVNGVPRDADCSLIREKFAIGTGAQAFPDAGDWDNRANENTDGNPAAEFEFVGLQTNFNPLRGALTIVGGDDGVGFGTSAMALANWSSLGADLGAVVASNHITAQEFPYFLEPTIVSGAANWTVDDLIPVDQALEANTVINEWANNPINGAATDWVIQFPTKGYHVDIPYANKTTLTGCDDSSFQAAYNRYRSGWPAPAACIGTTTDADLAGLITPFEERFGVDGSKVTVEAVTYDKEERKGTIDGVSFSPAQPTASNTLPWESNIITFGGPSVLNSSSAELILDPVNSIANSESNGQMFLRFSNADTVAGTNNQVMGNFGLPVIGFVAKERDQGDTSRSYGQIMDHSYENGSTSKTAAFIGPMIIN